MRQTITQADTPTGESGVDYNRCPKRSVPSERRKSGQLRPELGPLLLYAIKRSNLKQQTVRIKTLPHVM